MSYSIEALLLREFVVVLAQAAGCHQTCNTTTRIAQSPSHSSLPVFYSAGRLIEANVTYVRLCAPRSVLIKLNGIVDDVRRVAGRCLEWGAEYS